METPGAWRGENGAGQLGRLLAPLDGSERAELVLPWLPFLPIQRLTLLRVCEAGEGAEGAQAYLAEVARRLGTPGYVVETLTVTGCPAESIVAAAVETDLLIMSTRGAGGGGRLLFGSVADRVARHAPTPALLLRGGRTPVNPAALQRVIVPLDGSAAAERALPIAAILAQSLSCGIQLVHVIEPSGSQGASEVSLPRSYLDEQAAGIDATGISTVTEHRSGSPASELLQLVQPGDLLVMTTHGKGAARRWQIGGVAEKLLRQAPAPVVLVRADTP